MVESRSSTSQDEKPDEKPEEDPSSPEEHSSSPSTSQSDLDSSAERDTAGSLPNPGPGHPMNGEDAEKQAFLVKWEDGEKDNPRNFTPARKAFITFQLGMLALAASLGSSIISPAEPHIAKYLGLREEVTILTVSLYVLGFAFGYVN